MEPHGFIKVEGQCWENYMATQPQLSSGEPEEALTPNQIAEQAASQAALKNLVEDKRADLQKYGMMLLAKHVGCGPRDAEEYMTAAELRAWAAGWKAGNQDSNAECPETDPNLKRLWLDGMAAGFKTMIMFEREDMERRSGKPFMIKGRGKARSAAEVIDPKEMETIWKAYIKNGGTMFFAQIEFVEEFNLRWANGMTAYRIIKKYDEMQKVAG